MLKEIKCEEDEEAPKIYSQNQKEYNTSQSDVIAAGLRIYYGNQKIHI